MAGVPSQVRADPYHLHIDMKATTTISRTSIVQVSLGSADGGVGTRH